MASSPKGIETASFQSESKDKNDNTQQASDVLSGANGHPISKCFVEGPACDIVEGETSSGDDAIPKVSLSRLSLILSTLWVCKPSTRMEIEWKLTWVISS
jgi:hypothetical protein